MAFAEPAITLDVPSADEASGDFTLTVSAPRGEKFPQGSVVVVNVTEGLAPDPTTSTDGALAVTITNTVRAVGVYQVQVRFPDGRMTAPAALTIADVP